MASTTRIVSIAVILAALAAGGYYTFGGKGGQSPQQHGGMPPPDVGVIDVKSADVPLTLAYAGRVAGFRTVEIRSMVSGTIMKREYIEGARVRQGDVLFRIDERPYKAAFDRANAQLAQAKATSLQAEENFKRIEELNAKQVATPKQLEDARAARDQARAAIKSAEADIETARLNLEFTVVKAPVSGPTSLLSPPEGSIAQAQQTVLTTITQLDPAYVNFSVTDAEYREFRELSEGRNKPLGDDDISVSVQFGDGTTYPQNGKVIMSSQNVDLRTGTVQIRTVFPNSDGVILPGQFVRVTLKGITLPKAIVIPQQAVSQGPQGTFVFAVNAQGAAEVRPVKLDREIGTGWVVREGLKEGDKIIVDGVMRVRPGAPVKASPYQPKQNGAAKAADAKSADAKPADTKAAGAKPEAKTADAKPADAKSADAKPASADAKPNEAKK
ncbi:secretion protein HlyD [Afipia sp. P52-10]|jgi:membrane fusion protein (multidrug efflux system)|uniref:efflux RND transporter periplasmic adaptor subunit n=1 Tax=Afipia sp. P52-10 TaxID=1429916 RepID=UPI0003DF3ADD|nr:efflux RND transporter periplasmic adaptor subunit [Afipia sp. P52-10]ETR76326.1 secretion protein HlyD [Afipia sp. P52-10]